MNFKINGLFKRHNLIKIILCICVCTILFFQYKKYSEIRNNFGFSPYYTDIGFTEKGRSHFFKGMTEEEIEENFVEIYKSVKANLQENIDKGYITYEKRKMPTP